VYSFSGADMDARTVMEQRIQSLVCCVSMINRVLENDSRRCEHFSPIKIVSIDEAVQSISSMLSTIPSLLRNYLLGSHHASSSSAKTADCTSENTEKQSKILAAISDINKILHDYEDKSNSKTVRGQHWLRRTCYDIRQVVLAIEPFQSKVARYRAFTNCSTTDLL
jgi:hypothetical protein